MAVVVFVVLGTLEMIKHAGNTAFFCRKL